MVAPRVIRKDSALSERVKRQTLMQEIIRIRSNTNEKIQEERRIQQMSRFSWKLMLAGCDSRSRKEILLAGLQGFERLVELEKKGRRSPRRS